MALRSASRPLVVVEERAGPRTTSSTGVWAGTPRTGRRAGTVELARLERNTRTVARSTTLERRDDVRVDTPTTEDVGLAPHGFSFSPGAMLLPYYLGVADELQQRGYITDRTPLAGTSAGFILVTLVAAQLPLEVTLAALSDFLTDLREGGTISRVQPVMRRMLGELLPADIHERLNARRGGCACGITALRFDRPLDPLQPLVIRSFRSKADVLSAVEASGWTPGWIAPALTTRFREHPHCIDGFATSFLPDPRNCDTVVKVTASHAQALAVLGLVDSGDVDIHPGADAAGGQFNFLELTMHALAPYEDDVMLKLVEDGRRAAVAWVERQQPSL